MTSPVVTLRIDYSGAPFGSAFTWTDFTSYLMAREGVKITWGRQDEQSECAPRTCSFLLSNPSGLFSPGDPLFPATFPPTFGGIGWDIGTPVNIRLTEPTSSAVIDRFTGYVDSIEPTWPGGTQDWSVVRVNCTDVTAVLGTRRPLRSMVVQEMLADSPTYLYALDEPAESGSAGDLSPNKTPAAVRVDGKYGPGVMTFGSEMTGLTDTSTGVNFGTNAAGSTAVVSVLAAANNSVGPFVSDSTPHSVECWFVAPDAIPADNAYLLYQSKGSGSSAAILGIFYTGALGYIVQDAGGIQNAFPIGAASVCDGLLHHAVATLNADRKTCKLYVDGVLLDTDVASVVLDLTGLRYNLIGGLINTNATGYQFPGTISLVAMYPTELSAARVLAHYQAGKGTLVETTAARYQRLCGYAGLTPTVPTTDTLMGSQGTAGKTLVDALNTVARTENAPSYVTGAGALKLQARDLRYNATAAFALSASQIRPPSVRRDRLGVANQVTVTRNGGATQFVVDEASQASPLGVCDGGSFDVAPATDEDALNLAAWKVAIGKTPQTRIPSLTVPLHSASNSVITSCLLAGIGDLISVTGLPVTSPFAAADLFIEGGSETISLTGWEIEFFTSQNLPDVWSCASGASVMDGASARVAL